MRWNSIRTAAVAIAVAVIASVMTVVPSGAPAQAANAWNFNPGEIVSDAAFYDSSTMSAPDIQRFLESKVQNCRSGYTCLKDFRQDTFTRTADPMCGYYQGTGRESAADIIYKVGKSCGINPQVLIVLLEKEQSLITDDFPTDSQYRKATGYACPDTAPCDSKYNYFYNQVYMAAWAFKRYAMPPGTGSGTEWTTRFDRMYPVGQTSAIQYNPNRDCGTKDVYVRNQATHALYVYTPYVPNDSALAAGYGRGDGCGAYGNRNFYLLFTDWFSDPRYEVKGWIGDRYNAADGGAGVLGAPTENERQLSGGAVQFFRNGAIYCSADGAFIVRGWIRDRYESLGANGGVLRWPLADETALPGGASQRFSGGTVYASSLGAYAVTGAMVGEYTSRGGPTGALGYPAGDTGLAGGSVFQKFAGGTLNLAPTGKWITRGWIGDKYLALGGPNSWLGWPVENERSAPGGAVQLFERGAIITTSAGAFATSKDIAGIYAAAKGPASAVGHPVADGTLTGGGSSQRFQNGTYYVSSTGTWTVRGWIRDGYIRNGEQAGALGWPVGNEAPIRSGAEQIFKNGSIVSSFHGAYALTGGVDRKWRALGGGDGVIGFPFGDAMQFTGGRAQVFGGGMIFDSASGTYMVRGWIGGTYQGLGWSDSALGWPTADERALSGGAVQTFTGGSIYASRWGAYPVRGWIGDTYRGSGSETGPLGYPQSAERNLSGGAEQIFEGGRVVSSSAGAFAVRGWIGDKYRASGADTGVLGFPRGGERALTGGAQQDFRGGSVLASSVGAYIVRGSIGDTYTELGGQGSRLGYPLGDEYRSGSDYVQDFQGGRIIVNASGSSVQYK